MTNQEQMYDFSKKYAGRRLSPLKSIKAYCRDQCCASELESWRNCTFRDCLLWRYRLGLGNKTKGLKQGFKTQIQGTAIARNEGQRTLEDSNK